MNFDKLDPNSDAFASVIRSLVSASSICNRHNYNLHKYIYAPATSFGTYLCAYRCIVKCCKYTIMPYIYHIFLVRNDLCLSLTSYLLLSAHEPLPSRPFTFTLSIAQKSSDMAHLASNLPLKPAVTQAALTCPHTHMHRTCTTLTHLAST